MPKITAILHTHNDAQRIGRALDSLRVIDEVLVIDHGSTDTTRHVADKHGVTVKKGVPGVSPGAYAIDARHDWILCLAANEALSEGLEVALLEWKQAEQEANAGGFSMPIREEAEAGWQTLPAETRLVNRTLVNWSEELPANNPQSLALPGEILRFNNP